MRFRVLEGAGSFVWAELSNLTGGIDICAQSLLARRLAWSVPQEPCSDTKLRAANRDNGSKEAKRIKDVRRGIPGCTCGRLAVR
jgi:hypothetical protein